MLNVFIELFSHYLVLNREIFRKIKSLLNKRGCMTIREIADELALTPYTVDKYISRMVSSKEIDVAFSLRKKKKVIKHE